MTISLDVNLFKPFTIATKVTARHSHNQKKSPPPNPEAVKKFGFVGEAGSIEFENLKNSF